MQLCKVQLETGDIRVGVVQEGHVRFLDLGPGRSSLSDVLHSDHPLTLAQALIDEEASRQPLKDLDLLAPIDRQEVWAAGVTYKRSQEARERESAGAARFYDLVYGAARPELFFKANPQRVAGPGERVRIRKDSRWSGPEPELALWVSHRLAILGSHTTTHHRG